MTNIRGLRKIDGVRGRGEGAQDMVASESRGKTSEDHVKRDFGSSVGAVATGIRQAWWKRWSRGGVGLWK